MNTTKGIVVLAQNSDKVNYIQQACALAMSVKVTNPTTNISVITNDSVPSEYQTMFDKIIPIPFDDDASEADWKIENRWKIYHASPYDETLVLDSDVLILQDISTWWNFFKNYELFFLSKVYTYRQEIVVSDFYRKTFTANKLPNLYSGCHYFKKSDFAHNFYKWLELVMQNWELFYGIYAPELYANRASVDLSCSIVAKILDCESEITNSKQEIMRFVHMKSMIQGWETVSDSWRHEVGVYIDRNCNLKIGNFMQSGIFHYTENDFLDSKIIERYRNILNV